MLRRSWIVFSLVIALVQGVLGLLSVLQHDAVFSDLLRQRISVIAQTTATAFKPIIDLGLPISMIRNGDALVARALDTDPEISAVYAINPSGIVVYATDPLHPSSVPPDVLQAMQLSKGNKWSTETAVEIYSGFNVVGHNGIVAGAVVLAYPKDRLTAASQRIVGEVIRTGLLILVAFSGLSYLSLAFVFGGSRRRLAQLERIAREGAGSISEQEEKRGVVGRYASWRGLFGAEIEHLSANLIDAKGQYEEASGALAALAGSASALATDDGVPPQEAPATEITANPARSLARRIGSRLAPIAAVLIVSSALLLGVFVLASVNRSIEPELAARTNLIATVVGEDVQRALEAGVPLDHLVSAESFFTDMLTELPEIAYVAVATGRVVLEAGKRIDPYLAPPRERKDVRSHPIMHNGEEVAYVVIDVDPALISKKFLDVFLDMGVILLVAVLLAVEIMILMSSRSLTSELDRLQRLAGMQAVGDFSKSAVAGTRSAVDRATRLLVERAETLTVAFATAWNGAVGSAATRARLAALGQRYHLSSNGISTLHFSYFTDLRLALFLFAAAHELPLSFMPMFTRAAYNPFPWASESVLISLPLAGYLLAIVLVSPFARPLAHRLGPQRLLIAAAVPSMAAHVWLYLSSSVPEIVAAHVLLGVGYAFVTLACQDYVIDNTPREERDRALGMFSTVLFGGIFCGTALGGVLADRLGQANVFLLSSLLVAASALLIFWLVTDRRSGEPGQPIRAERPPLAAALRNRYFAALVFGIAIPLNITLQAFLSYLVALTLDSLGASPADIGRTLMAGLLAIAIVGPVAGRSVEGQMPAPLVVLSGAVLSALTLAVAVVWPTELGIFAAVLGVGIGEGLTRGSQVSIALSIAETELRRLGPDPVLGALRASERFGSIVGLVAIATVAGLYGFAAATATVAAITLAGAIAFGITVATRQWSSERQPAE